MKMMQILPVRQIKLMGLAVAIAAISYQPAIQAQTQPMPTTAVANEFIGAAHPTSGTAQIVEENGQALFGI